MEFKFAWGLGIDTNNMAEALALWKGLRISNDLGTTELIVIADSRVVIHALAENIFPTQLGLRHLLRKIITQASLFSKINFYHMLREKNPHVDLEANKGAALSLGELILNSNVSYCPPP